MGCDIHAYIDFDDFKTKDGDWYVTCFATNVYIGRNYELFALMAGVRYDENRMDGKQPLFTPKGIPEQVSWNVVDAYTLFVANEDFEGSCTSKDAQKWVKNGSSEWWNDDKSRVTHPDWHSTSWLTVQELEQVHMAYQEISSPEMSWYQSPNQILPENAKVTGTGLWGIHVEVGERKTNKPLSQLSAIIAAMKELDGNTPGRARLVFWFDN